MNDFANMKFYMIFTKKFKNLKTKILKNFLVKNFCTYRKNFQNSEKFFQNFKNNNFENFDLKFFENF